MKLFLAILTIALSTSAFAGTYEDRQAEINARRHQNEVNEEQKSYLSLNRNYLRRMATFAARHKGLATAVSCKAHGAEYRSERDSSSTMVIAIANLSATVEYVNEDLTTFTGISHEPQITACSLEFRDGLACKTWTRDAVHHDEVGWAGVMADCVTPSLKESRVDLGSIL